VGQGEDYYTREIYKLAYEMKRLLALIILIYIGHSSYGQKIAELDRRNGFKELKLGMVIDSVVGFKLKKEFKEKEEFDAKLFAIENPALATIGEVAVNKVEAKTYKDLIYQIHVVTDKDPRIMKALESIYGVADYDMKRETYFWRGQNLILKFRSYSKSQLEMIYTSFPVLAMMKTDKHQKVQDIADDF
jgi:hypothetical protein